jgi:hypothetical protein
MRTQSPEHDRRDDRSLATAMSGATQAVLVAATIGLGGGAGIAPAAAQDATVVAYVEEVNGRVVASSAKAVTLLHILDTISDRTQQFLALNGPGRAVISEAGVLAEGGKAVAIPGGACSAPIVSSFQGGFVTRGMPRKSRP